MGKNRIPLPIPAASDGLNPGLLNSCFQNDGFSKCHNFLCQGIKTTALEAATTPQLFQLCRKAHSVQYLPWKPRWGAWGSWSAALCAPCPWYRPPEPAHSSGRCLTGGYSIDQSKQHLEQTNCIRNRTSVLSLLAFACSTVQACREQLQQNSRALCVNLQSSPGYTKCTEWADMRNHQLNSVLPSPHTERLLYLEQECCWVRPDQLCSPWHLLSVQRFLFRAWNNPSFTPTASVLIAPCHILHIILLHHFLICYIHLSLPHLLSIFLTQHRTEQAFVFLLPKPLQENIFFSQSLLFSIFGISCKDFAWTIPLPASYSMALSACPWLVCKSRNSAVPHVSFLSSQSVPCAEIPKTLPAGASKACSWQTSQMYLWPTWLSLIINLFFSRKHHILLSLLSLTDPSSKSIALTRTSFGVTASFVLFQGHFGVWLKRKGFFYSPWQLLSHSEDRRRIIH